MTRFDRIYCYVSCGKQEQELELQISLSLVIDY